MLLFFDLRMTSSLTQMQSMSNDSIACREGLVTESDAEKGSIAAVGLDKVRFSTYFVAQGTDMPCSLHIRYQGGKVKPLHWFLKVVKVQAACLPEAIKAGVRITVDMGSEASYATSALSGERLYSAKLAKLSDPTSHLGLYWGYQTRIACNMRELLKAGPFEVSNEMPQT